MVKPMAVRIIVSLLAASATLLLGGIAVSMFSDHRDEMAIALALPFAAFAGWVTWRSQRGRRVGPVSSALAGAIVVGSVGFAGGFFGPMLLFPEANQGPLLGILITGPGGVVLGAIAGFVHWLRRGRDAGSSP